jgi:hypothetical protein
LRVDSQLAARHAKMLVFNVLTDLRQGLSVRS